MGILNWGFRSTIKIHQSSPAKSIDLPLTKKSTEDGEERLKFTEFVNRLTLIDPSKKLWLNPLLFNGTLQTLYYTSIDVSKKFQIWYGRELFYYSDGGSCSLDWVIQKPESIEEFKKLDKETLPNGYPKLHPRTRYLTSNELNDINKSQETNTNPIVVILHGLGGGSHEPLIRNFAQVIGENTSGWDIVVLNNRGCCRTKITSGQLFNAASTNDIREVLVRFKKQWPNRPIFAVGFSFGAALLSNFLGEEGKTFTEKGQEEATATKNLVTAACAVGCPWDFVDSAYHIQSSYTGKYLLNPALAKFLAKIAANNYKELSQSNPQLINEETMKELKKIKTTWEFDELLTCKLVSYKNAFQYYREVSPIRKILDIKTPYLILNSTDDPAVGCRLPILDAQTNPYLCLVETDLGGHLGYIQSNGEFWCVKVVEEFLQKFAEL
ncbi:EHT1 [Candida oxycetoniae]|uniref:EHT1 n=1 Tax=Candida oxycetoniae TaxID=497107 RepID=A0AAI9WXB8_9ASCO|nr:EHT1 [Candida oxycetoniae]KAI3403893.1 EHT1 [Candida oxycetoniae]